MLGVSCGDLISSIIVLFTPFMLPQNNDDEEGTPEKNLWAIGNDTSCTIAGFMAQLGLCSPWYSLMLSIYFLLLVKYGVKETKFAKNYESWMHLVCIGYPLITAILGASMGLYEDMIGVVCW